MAPRVAAHSERGPVIASQLMTATPFAIGADAPLSQAVRLMTDRGVSGLPVLDAAGHVAGVLTEGDLLRRVEIGTAEAAGRLASLFTSGRSAGNYVRTHGRRVRDAMTSDVVSIREDTPVTEVVRLMQRHGVKRLPVVRDGRLVGIVSRADLVRAIRVVFDRPGPVASDEAIRDSILAEMKRERWVDRSVTIRVEDGIVMLDGCVFDPRQRAALAAIAENAPGVGGVENWLVCIDARSGIVICDAGQSDEIP